MAAVTISTPLKLPCGVVIQNRIAKGAMTEALADPATNAPNEQWANLYSEWGKTGAGILITGNIFTDRIYLECPANVVIEDEQYLDVLQSCATRSQAHGSKTLVQVSHPGRQCPLSVTTRPVCPSAAGPVRSILPVFFPPRALTVPEIERIIQQFVNTSAIVQKAGFAGVQIHSAHGYLLSQFLSPRVNTRTDEYGGTPEKRRRLLRDIVRAVRARTSGAPFVISVKLNSADFQKGGFSNDESIDVVRMLNEEGVDLVEISGGTYENPILLQLDHYAGGAKKQSKQKPAVVRESTREREAFYRDYVSKLRSECKGLRVPIMLTGGFRTAQGMAAALTSGEVDVIGIGRPFATQPERIADFLQPDAVARQLRFDSLALPVPFGLQHLEAGVENLWHQQQIHLIASGQAPNMRIGILYALTFQTLFTYVWSPRRTSKATWIKIMMLLGALALASSALYVRLKAARG